MNQQKVVNSLTTTINVTTQPQQDQKVVLTVLNDAISESLTSGDTDSALHQVALLATVNVTNQTESKQIKAQAINFIAQIAKEVSTQDKTAFVMSVLST